MEAVGRLCGRFRIAVYPLPLFPSQSAGSDQRELFGKMLLSAAILILAPGVLAGMYGKPVINLDAKTFKQAMSVEHASVSIVPCLWAWTAGPLRYSSLS